MQFAHAMLARALGLAVDILKVECALSSMAIVYSRFSSKVTVEIFYLEA